MQLNNDGFSQMILRLQLLLFGLLGALLQDKRGENVGEYGCHFQPTQNMNRAYGSVMANLGDLQSYLCRTAQTLDHALIHKLFSSPAIHSSPRHYVTLYPQIALGVLYWVETSR